MEEVLYGGAAGGGKSDAALMSAAQFVEVPGYSALLLRRSFPDLMQADALIPRSKEWWLGKADWSAQGRRWTFPSGATITFGYLERDDDVYQYQGAAYQYIGIDELTQHTEFRYNYLFSRLRRPAEGPLAAVPLRMRGFTNPGGIGHAWVRQRFVKPPVRATGTAFVPASLIDNPALDTESYLRSLGHLDPLTRDQLLKGDWDAVASGRCKREWLRSYRLTSSVAGITYATTRTFDATSLRRRFLTVDTAATVKETAKDDPDYTVISAWGISPGGELLWLGCERHRLETPDIIPLVGRAYAIHRAQAVYVESGGTQKTVAQYLRLHQLAPGRHMSVIEWLPGGRDKLSNAGHFLNAAEAGRVWLPDPADVGHFPHEEVLNELLRFTGDEKRDGHDDIVTTASIAGWVLLGENTSKVQDFRPYTFGGKHDR